MPTPSGRADHQSLCHSALHVVDPAALYYPQVKVHSPLRDCSRRSANPDPPRACLAQTLPDLMFSPSWHPSGGSFAKERIMTIGTVKFFNSSKGFGFIAPEGGAKDVFVHATALEAAGMTSLSEGQKLSFDIQPDAKGSKAVNLRNA